MSTYTNRVVDVAVSETDKTTLVGYKIKYHLNNMLSINVVPERLLTDNLVSESAPIVSGADDYTIVDTDYTTECGLDRFIYISTLKTSTSKRVYKLYYDRKYSDIILIPDTSFMQINPSYYIHRVIETSGYIINFESDATYDSDICKPDEATKIDLPEVTTTTQTRNLLTVIPNYHSQGGIDTYYEEMLSASVNYSSRGNYPVNVLDLGIPSTLLINTKIIVPINTIGCTDMFNMNRMSLGARPLQDGDHLVVILPF